MKMCHITLAAVVLVGCGQYRQVSEQLPTFANMQTVAKSIQAVVELDGSISDKAASEIIASVNGGLDDWGNQLLYRSRRTPEFSFVLVSPGRDGVFEHDPTSYFETLPENIVGELNRDIIFRDGRPVTNASGK